MNLHELHGVLLRRVVRQFVLTLFSHGQEFHVARSHGTLGNHRRMLLHSMTSCVGSR
jgi:hypothetical protein